ncbi:3-deoxy-8-phosphooctulonate synthase [candidate division GN15 bacterium]|uniref:3-deoxy-8-phosphooctulonate synthase n=1 Tax=candidate division GN15 bacterium TaxID=2072418 RepID=A0A855X3D6_9BACT|nr:MAG: 3-deoxy-8-phosphooctulonate synthase [candidate division GN15 bacterium]
MVNDTLKRIENGEFFLIAGPCVAESEQLCDEVASNVGTLAKKYHLPYVFKASYRKANRLSGTSYAGPGAEQGLEILSRVKEKHGVAILTDVHETVEVEPAAQVADILQIPAFLCRQTDLVVRAAATGKWVNIKKGQFLAPEDMASVAAKAGSRRVMLTERGTTFGYRNLVVDFRSLLIMKQTGLPVVFDATHSLQLPGAGGGVSSGQPHYIIPMARAAAAVGIDGLFVETHPEPSKALSDAGAMLPLSKMEELLEAVLAIRRALK